jgi:osomolarity two-component system, response regulator SSK1
MGDLKARFKPLFRKTSTLNSAKSSASSASSPVGDRYQSKNSLLLSKNRKPSASEPVREDQEDSTVERPATSPTTEAGTQTVRGRSQQTPDTSLETSRSPLLEKDNPLLQVQEPTPQPLESSAKVVEEASEPKEILEQFADTGAHTGLVTSRPAGVPRTQSLADSSQNRSFKTLLAPEKPRPRSSTNDYFGAPPTTGVNMHHRKIWVKRPGASATLVTINEDDLVDDVRDMILRKYANSLGRTFDAPDVTLRIIPRDQANRNSYGERTLGPEEPISRTLDAYFPGGQSVGEALLIDVPQRRTPRHSPRVSLPYYLSDDLRPGESGTEYFPPMPVAGQHSPHLPSTLSASHSGPAGSHNQVAHSIAILNTGQAPPLPSPGARGTRQVHTAHLAHGALRPKHVRTHTSSPPILTGA